MTSLKTPIICLLYSMICFCGYGQKEILELDLTSIPSGGIKTISENANVSYKAIKLNNIVPAKKYFVWFENEVQMLDPLDLSGLSSDEKVITDSLLVVGIELLTYLSNLEGNDSLTEEDIKSKIKPELKAQIKNYRDNISKEKEKIANILDAEEKRTKLQQLAVYDSKISLIINATDTIFQRQISIDVQVGSGEIGRIYVSSVDSKWTFVLKGRQLGKWVTTYGFGFTSQRTESRTYFAKQIPDTTVFQILKARRAEVWDLNYVPAVFFSYFPSQKFNSCWNHSLTAGLGFGLNLSSAPIVFFGYNGMFYNNIGLSAGVGFHQQHRLKSQYSEYEIISETLDKDQLHDKVYRPSLFFSINFRFGKNPFKVNDESDND